MLPLNRVEVHHRKCRWSRLAIDVIKQVIKKYEPRLLMTFVASSCGILQQNISAIVDNGMSLKNKHYFIESTPKKMLGLVLWAEFEVIFCKDVNHKVFLIFFSIFLYIFFRFHEPFSSSTKCLLFRCKSSGAAAITATQICPKGCSHTLIIPTTTNIKEAAPVSNKS